MTLSSREAAELAGMPCRHVRVIDQREDGGPMWCVDCDVELNAPRAAMNGEDAQFMEDALEELDRARAKFPGEEDTLTDSDWLAVLVEEVGEAARAMQDETRPRLREELVQVAAVACRWAGAPSAPWKLVPWKRPKEGS